MPVVRHFRWKIWKERPLSHLESKVQTWSACPLAQVECDLFALALCLEQVPLSCHASE